MNDKIKTFLMSNGKVLTPLSSYGFSEKYGWLEDKFRVSWQLNYEGKYN